ncbi:MAG TPA: hypothetical protein VJN96_11905 [Vicinamibacterales bacterium]|nr:hypothetical protein [Vicinamibacterales bacterium]
MKRVILGLSAAAMIAGGQIVFGQGQGQGQGQGNAWGRDPFFDQSDTGEIIKVLPTPASIHSPRDTQPTFASPSDETSVFPASYGSSDLINHGGPQIPNAAFLAIYWNDKVAKSTATSTLNGFHYTTIQQQIAAFAQSFATGANWSNSATDDYTVIQQYGSSDAIANSLFNRSDVVDTRATTGMIKDSGIRSYLKTLFDTHKVIVDPDTVYGIYFPPGMKVSLQGTSCSQFCGYHSHFTYNGLQIRYAAFPYLDCSACKLSTLTVADMLTIVTSHEIREAVTDPQGNAWFDSSGYEADDKCAWHHLYQTTGGGFFVQPEYSNGGTVMASGFTASYPHGCVVPNQPVPHRPH